MVFIIGSPAPLYPAKPKPYKRTRYEVWRPARAIPKRCSKAQRLIDILNDLERRAADARSILRPDAAVLREWQNGSFSIA